MSYLHLINLLEDSLDVRLKSIALALRHHVHIVLLLHSVLRVSLGRQSHLGARIQSIVSVLLTRLHLVVEHKLRDIVGIFGAGAHISVGRVQPLGEFCLGSELGVPVVVSHDKSPGIFET